MDPVNNVINLVNGLLFSDWVVYALLLVGLLFTAWTVFGQWRALTHGVAVVRGKYDESEDPGAINHFQALSTALSATVGLGNIGGVALAVAIGGPGAVLWMWVIGVVGMALKMTEVTQSMLFRDTARPEEPHGGPMFVAKYGFARAGRGPLVWVGAALFALTFGGLGLLGIFQVGGTGGTIVGVVLLLIAVGLLALAAAGGAIFGATVGGLFVVTLITSAITGGNMFQAWNVADITFSYFGLNQFVVGVVLAVLVGAVIIGGIRVIGRVTGTIVPVMCVLYVAAALYVLVLNVGELPGLLRLIVVKGLPGWLGGEATTAAGAFTGVTFGVLLNTGIQRALFSSEAGQGSAPIAHSAVKTDEPVREGVVAGLEPFIDTIVVCTMTALVILSTGTWNRDAEASYASAASVEVVPGAEAGTYTLSTPALPPKRDEDRRIQRIGEGEADWKRGETVFALVDVPAEAAGDEPAKTRVTGVVEDNAGTYTVDWAEVESEHGPPMPVVNETGGFGIYGDYKAAALTGHAFDRVTPGLGQWLIVLACWLFAVSTMISWSYYGEQGIVYLFGENRVAILVYKLGYCAIIALVCIPGFFATDEQLNTWTTLGLGVMLVVNIPLMLVFAPQAMRAYHDYFRRERAGPMHDEIQDDGTTPESRA